MGIGSPLMRSRVAEGLSHLGIVIDAGLNEKAKPLDDISDTKSKIRLFVLKTDEEEEIAKAVKGII